MQELKNSLVTTKYTKVFMDGENDIRFNAPHNFKVFRVGDNEVLANIHFQGGAIKEAGVNGVANEDLIAMVLERLYFFDRSLFSCKENEKAIEKLEEALMWLRKRTDDRALRGVKGKNQV